MRNSEGWSHTISLQQVGQKPQTPTESWLRFRLGLRSCGISRCSQVDKLEVAIRWVTHAIPANQESRRRPRAAPLSPPLKLRERRRHPKAISKVPQESPMKARMVCRATNLVMRRTPLTSQLRPAWWQLVLGLEAKRGQDALTELHALCLYHRQQRLQLQLGSNRQAWQPRSLFQEWCGRHP